MSTASFAIKNRCAAVLAALALLSATVPARAIYLTEDGAKAFLRGPIETGDDKELAAFLAKPRPQKLQVIYLDSWGGALEASIHMARMVRKAGLATAVDARKAPCDSACTVIFAGGVRRYNVGGESVYEGFSSFTGLGYHSAHVRGDITHFSMKSDVGTRRMTAVFAEMGMPRAAELAAKAATNTIYRPGGKTTLDMHIATSLGAPELRPALRSDVAVHARVPLPHASTTTRGN